MKMFKKLLSLATAAALAATSLNLGVFAEGAETNHSSEYHRLSCVSTDGPSEYGYVPFKIIDENGNEIEPNLKSSAEQALKGTLPAKFSLIDKGYLPAIRHQGTEGSCWAHAGMAMAESNMIMSGLASASSVDFSEKHLAWFAIGASAPAGDPLYGDFGGLGAETAYDGGGNLVDVMFTLMAWMGVEQEAHVPYRDFTQGVDESHRYHSFGHLQNVNVYDNSDVNSIKQAIMRDGAVQIAYYASANDAYLTKQNAANFAAYYCPTAYTTNHSITVVGWDDNFSKSNFKAGGTPTNDGAWLCRNSWGSSWGTNGYFYMSYEDATVKQFSSLTMESNTNYGKVYQYDGGCEHRSDGYIYSWDGYKYSGFSGAANVFTATADDSITAVSYYTPMAGWKYTIKVYTNLTGANPGTGTLVSAATVSGTADYSGYHTVKLASKVAVKKGTKFAVSVDLSDSSGDHYVITDYNSPSTGISYFCDTGTWMDSVENGLGNVRVKAYTANSAIAKPTNIKTFTGNGTVALSWDAVSGAAKYVVFSYLNGAYTLKATVTSPKAAVTGLKNGVKYGFLVRAVAADGTMSAATTDDLVYATPAIAVTKPTNIQTFSGNGVVALSWNAVSGAVKYNVYTYLNSKYTLKASVKSPKAAITGLKNGVKYGFLVRAVAADGSLSPATNADLVYETPSSVAKPTNVTTFIGNGVVALSWTPVTGAAKYKVFSYRNGAYTLQATVTSPKAAVTGLTNGVTYGFLVRAVASDGTMSPATNADLVYDTPYIVGRPTNIKTYTGDGVVALSWTAVTGAKGYKVFYYLNGKYTQCAVVTSPKVAVTGLKNGVKYGFLVRAIAPDGSLSPATAANMVYATPNA